MLHLISYRDKATPNEQIHICPYLTRSKTRSNIQLHSCSQIYNKFISANWPRNGLGLHSILILTHSSIPYVYAIKFNHLVPYQLQIFPYHTIFYFIRLIT